jgi:hypothetical protein
MRNLLPLFFYRKLAEFRIRRKASELRNRWADGDNNPAGARSCTLCLREPPAHHAPTASSTCPFSRHGAGISP